MRIVGGLIGLLLVVGCTPAPTPSAAPSASPQRTTARSEEATLRPTGTCSPLPSLGPEAWERVEIDVDVATLPLGLWSVGETFLLVAERDTGEDVPGWLVLRSRDGREWQVDAVSPEVEKLFAGAVVDGRLWFVGRVRDADGVTSRLLNVGPEGDWQLLSRAEGLRARDDANFLARVGDRWVASTIRLSPGEPFPDVDEDVRSSRDGVHWTVARTPYPGNASYFDAAMLGGTAIVRGVRGEGEAGRLFTMSSRDGIQWRAADVAMRGFSRMYEFACGASQCVGTGSRTDADDEHQSPITWTTRDGLRWTEVEVPVPTGHANAGMDEVVASESGFVALGEDEGDAWRSVDGVVWKHADVIPRGQANPQALAVSGDLIVALDDDGSGLPTLGFYLGSVAHM